MRIETINNGITDCTVLFADEGKELFCIFNETNCGNEVWLGYVYYDKDSNELAQPYMLTANDFTEVDIITEVDEITE